MTLLENELVKTYFGCPPNLRACYHHDCEAEMALRVVQAMEGPIKKGEWILQQVCGSVRETTCEVDQTGFHGHLLRLPDRFQEAKCGPGIVRNGIYECACINHKPPEQPKKEYDFDQVVTTKWLEKRTAELSKKECECQEGMGAMGVGTMPCHEHLVEEEIEKLQKVLEAGGCKTLDIRLNVRQIVAMVRAGKQGV